MPRYVAFLRGVSPTNCRMPELKAAFEQAGFENVKTVLASGNVVFDSRKGSDATLAGKCEQAMDAGLGKRFATIVRSQDELAKLIESDPFAAHRLPAKAKRVVTFLRDHRAHKVRLPIEQDDVHILEMIDGEVFIAYVPQPGNPAFMNLIQKTFGKDVTTRTWDTVAKCAIA